MATLTVTIPDSAVTRVRNAAAAVLGVPAPASTTQVQDFCRSYLRSICLQVEQQAREKNVPTDSEIAVAVDFPST